MNNKRIDDDFFSTILSNWGVNPLQAPPRSTISHDISNPTIIDIRGYNYVSLFDLVNLFLLVDYSQATRGYTQLRFDGISPYDDYVIMPIHDYNLLRRKDIATIPEWKMYDYQKAHNTYSLLSFCHHYGLFDALDLQRRARTLMIEGLGNDLLSNLHAYGGVSQTGSRVMKILPIRLYDDIDCFKMNNSIEAWLSSLPRDISSAPIFKDGEFSHVLGYQLCLNILEHSGSSWRGEYGASGAIAMRVISPTSIKQLAQSMPTGTKILDRVGDRGLLEICVCDRGYGIINTLKDSYKNFKNTFGLKNQEENLDILAFAFDELGTRKKYSERMSGVHALHRILKCIAKYNGIMKVRCCGAEYVYDSSLDQPFNRNDNGIGIYPTSISFLNHMYGTQFQLFLPLTTTRRNSQIFYKREQKRRVETTYSKNENFRIVQIGAFHDLLRGHDLALRLVSLREELLLEPNSTRIIFDFSGISFSEDDVVNLLSSLKPVLHTHTCMIVNIDSKIAYLLREREKLNISDDKIPEQDRQLFYILSVKHRLLPVYDNSRSLVWFGLGSYDYDYLFNDIVYSANGISIKTIEKKLSKEELEAFQVYLNSNSDLFSSNIMNNEYIWKSNLKSEDFDCIIKKIVRLKLPEIIHEYNCVTTGGAYKVPSRNEYYDCFIQSAPLMQAPIINYQICDWFITAINLCIDSSLDILIITSTAPAELIARAIVSRTTDRNIDVINIGYYSSLDDDNLLKKEDWENASIVVVSDIIDKENTVAQIYKFANKKGFKIDLLLSLLRFVKRGSELKTLYWDPEPFNSSNLMPRFFIGDYHRPEVVEQGIFDQLSDEQKFYAEPYSLELFSHSSLSGKFEERFPKIKINLSRLQLLEEAGAIRSGHWVYGSHHFAITTCVKKLLTDDIVGAEICGEIIEIIKNNDIDHVLLPLHSHICDIIPRVITGINISLRKKVTFTYCISTKVLASRSFYVLPKQIKHEISEFSKSNKSTQQGSGLRFLILDDAVATGRTLETLVRALILQGRKYIAKYNLINSPIEHVHAYSVLDRQGRAKSTLLTGIQNISFAGDGEWQYTSDTKFSFKYERWLDIDLPVSEKESCEICKERDDLQALVSADLIPSDHSAILEINRRLSDTQPRSTEIPTFNEIKERKIPTFDIGRIKGAETVELVLWEFHNLLHRGSPFWYLLEEYDKFCSANQVVFANTVIQHNIQYLKLEILRLFFKNWERLNSQWAGNKFIDSLKEDIANGSDIAKHVLGECGKTLAISQSDYREFLIEIFEFSVKELISDDDSGELSGKRRENIAQGLVLFGLYCNFHVQRNAKLDSREGQNIISELLKIVELSSKQLNNAYYVDTILDEIKSVIIRSSQKDNYMPALLTVFNHTIRPGRHRHPHLLPALLVNIVKEKSTDIEMTLVRDVIVDLLFCMDIIEKRNPSFFESKAKEVMPIIKNYMKDLSDAIDVGNSGNIKVLSTKLLNHYPHNLTSTIYRSLKRSLVPIINIIKGIEYNCRKFGIEYDFKHDGNLDNVNVILPSEYVIAEVVRNFTSGARISSEECLRPTVTIDVKYSFSDYLNKIHLVICTNFYNSDESIAKIAAGPGIKEVESRLNKLYRIYANIYKSEYDTNITIIDLEMCLGLPT